MNYFNNFLNNTRNSVFKIFIALLVSSVISGCATITSGTSQTVRVDALDEQGLEVEDAKCELTNNSGSFQAEPGKPALVRKAWEPLHVKCTSETHKGIAHGEAISRVGSAMFGNIFIGGLIGATIDHVNSAAYHYPVWIQVVFGRSLVFDQRNSKFGSPLQGSVVTN